MDYLKQIAERIRNRLRDDGDAFIVIDGSERSGKSSLMLRLAILIDPNFSLGKIVYRKGKLIEKIYSNPKFSVIVHDELGLDAYNRRAMSSTNIELRQASMVWGDQNQAVIACVPNFWELDPGIRNNRVYLWIHVEMYETATGKLKRGYAEFHFANKNKWNPVPYWEEAYKQRFNQIPDHVYQEYKKQKHAAILKAVKEDGNNGTSERDDMILGWHDDGDSSYDIEKKLPTSHRLTRRRIDQVIEARKVGR